MFWEWEDGLNLLEALILASMLRVMVTLSSV